MRCSRAAGTRPAPSRCARACATKPRSMARPRLPEAGATVGSGQIRGWVAAAGAVHEVPPDEAIRAAVENRGSIWIDIDCAEESLARKLLEPLQIHPLVLEDVFAEVNRPKVDDYGRYLYVVVHSARWDEERPQLRELDMVL